MRCSFFRRLLLIPAVITGFYISLHAQEQKPEYKFEIGGMAGGAFYMGDLNKNAFFKGLNPAVGAVFRYNANFRWAFKANLTWARVSGSTDGLENVFPDGAQGSFSRSLIDMGGQMEFNFFPYSDQFAYANAKRFSPYVFLGIGLTVAPGSGNTFVGPNIPLGVGVKYKLTHRLNLGCEFSFRKLFGDGLDVTDNSNAFLDDPYHMNSSFLKNKDWYSFLTFTVTWDFGPRCKTCNNAKNIDNL